MRLNLFCMQKKLINVFKQMYLLEKILAAVYNGLVLGGWGSSLKFKYKPQSNVKNKHQNFSSSSIEMIAEEGLSN